MIWTIFYTCAPFLRYNHSSVDIHSSFQLVKNSFYREISQIDMDKTSMSIGLRSDTFESDPCLINVVLSIFVICKLQGYLLLSTISRDNAMYFFSTYWWSLAKLNLYMGYTLNFYRFDLLTIYKCWASLPLPYWHVLHYVLSSKVPWSLCGQLCMLCRDKVMSLFSRFNIDIFLIADVCYTLKTYVEIMTPFTILWFNVPDSVFDELWLGFMDVKRLNTICSL